MNGGPTIATSRTDAYRRRARRLRHVYAADPVGLQRSLAELARSCDPRTRAACGFANQAPRNYGAALPAKAQAEAEIDPSSRISRAAETFADMVSDRMIGPILPYAAREKLIRDATRMGIGRFEANLIIAAAQYRADRAERPERPETDNKYGREYGPLASFLAIAAVQATIVLGAWWMMS